MTQNTTNTVPFALKMLRLLFRVGSPLFPQLMTNYAYKLWITPFKSKMPDPEILAAKKAKASFMIIDGLKIRVWSWGQGPTVLFIHGWGGRGTQVSSFIEVLNNAGFRVLSFDFPAHGQSEGQRTNAFSIASALTKVIEGIDDLQGVITHSFAGIVFGFYYQSTIPLKKVVMISPPADLNTPFNQFTHSLALSDSIKIRLLKKLEDDFGHDVFERVSLKKNVQKISQPVLVVHDAQDETVPVQDGKEVANNARDSSFIETNGLGHIKILFNPEVVEKVKQFITQ